MIVSTTKKTISLAISLLVVVISLTGVALGAGAPSVSVLNRYTPDFAGEPGKMARDAAGNFYVADFWGKGIVKLNRVGKRIGFIATTGRPSAVTVMKDNRLVVAMTTPQPKIAFYKQFGDATTVSGEEDTVNTFPNTFPNPAPKLYRPVAITTDSSANEYIYVLDAGDSSYDTVNRVARIRVHNRLGAFLYAIGTRTDPTTTVSIYEALDDRLKQPAGIAYEKVANKIVVADTLNGRLVYYSPYNGTSMSPSSYIGSLTGVSPPTLGSDPVNFGNPVDVAFEYNSTPTLQRIYVAERGRDEVSVLDATTNKSTMYIPGTKGTIISGATMKLPSSLLFEKTSTGGVLYVNSAATFTAANVLALGIDGGTVPVQTPTMMTMSAVPATSLTSPISVSGTTSPAAAVSCTVNGVAEGSLTGDANWTMAGLNLQPSTINYIVCQSTSGSVTSYTQASTYYGADSTVVTVAITEPSAGLYTSTSPVMVTGTTYPGNATVQLTNSLGGTTTAQSDASGNWSKAVTLAEGSNLISATASRPGTNPSAAAIVTVVADFTPPNMTNTISFLKEGAITNNAVQNLDGIVTDDNLVSIEVNDVPVPVTAQVVLTSTKTYFSTPVILARGKNTVTIKATDRVGYSTTITRGIPMVSEISLKPEIPGMTVALPADNSYRSSAGTVTASGTTNAVFDSVNAAGITVTPSAGNWSTPSMNATLGFVSYQFTASGAGVDSVTEKRTINTGSYAQVDITSPPADYATKLSSVVISGTVPPGGARPQIVINGGPAVNVTNYASATGVFDHTVTLVAQGVNSYKIIAEGGTTAVRNIIYDTTLPDLTIQADSKPMPTVIYGTIEPSVKMSAITASLLGTAVTIPLSAITFDAYDQSGSVKWKADLTGYAYDTINFGSIDPAGNSVTLKYKEGIPTGDIDGDGTVRLADALAALRHVAGTELINPVTQDKQFFNGDVGGLINGRAARDGVIDISDAVLILNKAYGLMAF